MAYIYLEEKRGKVKISPLFKKGDRLIPNFDKKVTRAGGLKTQYIGGITKIQTTEESEESQITGAKEKIRSTERNEEPQITEEKEKTNTFEESDALQTTEETSESQTTEETYELRTTEETDEFQATEETYELRNTDETDEFQAAEETYEFQAAEETYEFQATEENEHTNIIMTKMKTQTTVESNTKYTEEKQDFITTGRKIIPKTEEKNNATQAQVKKNYQEADISCVNNSLSRNNYGGNFLKSPHRASVKQLKDGFEARNVLIDHVNSRKSTSAKVDTDALKVSDQNTVCNQRGEVIQSSKEHDVTGAVSLENHAVQSNGLDVSQNIDTLKKTSTASVPPSGEITSNGSIFLPRAKLEIKVSVDKSSAYASAKGASLYRSTNKIESYFEKDVSKKNINHKENIQASNETDTLPSHFNENVSNDKINKHNNGIGKHSRNDKPQVKFLLPSNDKEIAENENEPNQSSYASVHQQRHTNEHTPKLRKKSAASKSMNRSEQQSTQESDSFVDIFGIEGASNSSYIDTALVSLFLPWSSFLEVLNDFSSELTETKWREKIRSQLQDILSKLLQNGKLKLTSGRISLFRDSLSVLNFCQHQMDPDYFITTLFKDVIGCAPFYSVDGGEGGYVFQTFAPSTTNHISVRQLFQWTMEMSQIFFTELPSPGFIIKLPVTTGRRVFPNFVLDMKNFIIKKWTGPTEMILGAVICLEDNHFTTFIRPNKNENSEWRYLDSFKFGTVTSLDKLGLILSDEDNAIRTTKSLINWMITHAYICIYFPR